MNAEKFIVGPMDLTFLMKGGHGYYKNSLDILRIN